MFIEKSDICNFADDNALYKSSPSLSVVLNCLEHDITIVLNWLKVNSLKANPQKFHFLVLRRTKSFQYKCKIEDTYIFSKDQVVLLGITIDNKLTFEAHIENLCKKASCKLWVLQTIRKFLTVMKAKTLASSFVNSQFNYCATVWMFCSRKSKIRLENVHTRTLRVVYNEYEKNYKDLLVDHDEISINQKHLQFLATEVFKLANKLNPQFMWCFFENHDIPYNLRCGGVVELPGTNTTKYRTNSLNFRGAMLWTIIPKI